MAKKIVEDIKGVLKGRKKKEAIKKVDVKRKDSDTMITHLTSRVVFLEQRIDRIVSAIHNSKSVKDM